MDADVRADKPGVCPRCGMKLVLKIPERMEYPLEVVCSPQPLRPGQPSHFVFHVLDPDSNKTVRNFEIVHEKLMHLFIVSENLEYFAHEHPVLQPDGTFSLALTLPFGGMYRLLADFYPSGAVPQLALSTIFVSGVSPSVKLAPSSTSCAAANLSASLRTDPPELLAGLESRLTYSLTPSEDLQLYLGVWGHMLAVSSDLIDMLHVHPFLVSAKGASGAAAVLRDVPQIGGDIQFNIIFPRPGLYRIWTQFQRSGVVNTTVFTVPVKAL
jgi:hypothetical protein